MKKTGSSIGGTASIQSPVRLLRRESELAEAEFAAAFGWGGRWQYVLEAGGAEKLPAALVEFAEELRGNGGGKRLIADYAMFRESIGAAARARLEQMIYPAGKTYGLAPGIIQE